MGLHLGEVYGATLSPDKKMLVSYGEDGVRAWNLKTNAQVCHLKEHEFDVNSAAFSSDGLLLATAGDDAKVRIWSTRDWSCVQELSLTQKVVGVLFCQSSTRLLTAERSGVANSLETSGNRVRVWNTADWTQVGEPLIEHTDNLQGLCIQSDEKRIAVPSSDGSISVWDVETWKRLFRLETPSVDASGMIFCAAFAHDHPILAAAGGSEMCGKVFLWDTTNGRLVGILEGHRERVLGISWSPDDRVLAVVGDASIMTVHHFNEKLEVVGRNTLPSTCGAWSVLAVSNNELLSTNKDGSIRRRSLSAPFNETRIELVDSTIRDDHQTDFLFDTKRDSIYVAINGLQRFSLSKQSHEQSLVEGNRFSIRRIALSRDRRTLATFDSDRKIRFRELNGYVQRESPPLGPDFDRLRFIENDQFLIAGSGLDLKFLNVKSATLSTRSVAQVLSSHVEYAQDVDVACTIYVNGTIEISRGGQLVRRLRIPGDFRYPPVMLDDGTKVALRRQDGMVYVLDTTSLEEVDCMQVTENRAAEIAFLDSGSSLASIAADGILRIWHIPSGRQVMSINTQIFPPHKIEATPDSQFIGVTGQTADLRREFVLYQAPILAKSRPGKKNRSTNP